MFLGNILRRRHRIKLRIWLFTFLISLSILTALVLIIEWKTLTFVKTDYRELIKKNDENKSRISELESSLAANEGQIKEYTNELSTLMSEKNTYKLIHDKLKAEMFYNAFASKIVDNLFTAKGSRKPYSRDIVRVIRYAYTLDYKKFDDKFGPINLISLAYAESNFDPYDIGEHGEISMFQLLDAKSACKSIGIKYDKKELCKIENSCKAAAVHLYNKARTSRSFKDTIIAYNGMVRDKISGNIKENYYNYFMEKQENIRRMKDLADNELKSLEVK